MNLYFGGESKMIFCNGGITRTKIIPDSKIGKIIEKHGLAAIIQWMADPDAALLVPQ